MAQITFKGEPVTLKGKFPEVGDSLKNFKLACNDLSDMTLDNFSNCFLLLNIFPSVDTSVCAESVRTFNKEIGSIKNTKVLCISRDLPFAQARFCGAENINNVQTLSAFRNFDFAAQLGVEIADGLLKGLLARAIIILSPERKVLYTQLVSEITHKPDYEKCLTAMENIAG